MKHLFPFRAPGWATTAAAALVGAALAVAFVTACTKSPSTPSSQAGGLSDGSTGDNFGADNSQGAIASTDQYSSIQPLITQYCGQCHGASAQFPLTTFAQVTAAQSAMISKIQAGEMPKGNPNFANTQDGQRLLNWLQSGSDIVAALSGGTATATPGTGVDATTGQPANAPFYNADLRAQSVIQPTTAQPGTAGAIQ